MCSGIEHPPPGIPQGLPQHGSAAVLAPKFCPQSSGQQLLLGAGESHQVLGWVPCSSLLWKLRMLEWFGLGGTWNLIPFQTPPRGISPARPGCSKPPPHSLQVWGGEVALETLGVVPPSLPGTIRTLQTPLCWLSPGCPWFGDEQDEGFARGARGGGPVLPNPWATESPWAPNNL